MQDRWVAVMMMMGSRSWKRVARIATTLTVLALGAIGVLLPSCLDPTQITVDLHTNVTCSPSLKLYVGAGDPGHVEGVASANGQHCDGASGSLGSVVIAPQNTKTSSIGIIAVLGVDVDVSECHPPLYKGCIVQRRIVTYIPHTPLEIPIELLDVCKDVPCDSTSTCSARRQCVSAQLDPEQCIPPRQCFPSGDPGSLNNLADGGTALDGNTPVDAGSDGAATPDSGSGDGSSSSDAGDDGARPFHPLINCPVANMPCYDLCCISPTNPPSCPFPSACQPQDTSIRCDERADCPAGDYYCCGDPTGNKNVFCSLTTCGSGSYVCKTVNDCPPTYGQCIFKPDVLFGYYGECGP